MTQKITSTLLRCFSFLPSLLLLFLIFGFSAQDGDASGSLSYNLSLFVVKLFSPFLPTALSEDALYLRADAIHIFIRKAAHMTEYFLLTLSLHLPLKVYLQDKLSFSKRLIVAFFCSAFFAVTDEFHQTLVPGRSGNITDVCIDSIGSFLASLILWLSYKYTHKKSTL